MIVHNKQNVCKPKKKFTEKVSFQLGHKVLKKITRSINKIAVNEIAFSSKFIQRSTSKFNGLQFLTTMLISSIDSEQASLEKISDIFRSLYGIRIRAQSIMERLNDESAVIFFKSIFERILLNQRDSFTKEISPELLSSFSKILIQDSSKGTNEFRIRALIYARAILVLIINEIYKFLDYVGQSINKVVSIHKVYAWLRCANRLKRIISGKLCEWEEKYIDDVVITCLAYQNRKRKTTLQSIHDGDFYYMEAS